MAKSSSGRKRRAAAAAPVESDGEDAVHATPAAEPAGTQPRPSSQTNPYFNEDDEELQKFEEEIRYYTGEAERAVADNRTPLSVTEEEKLVRDVMRFMIFRNETKPNVPVPRGDLTKLFPAHRKGASGMVIKMAQAKFPDALGMEMKEIKVASAKAPAGTDDGAKYFVLRSYLPAAVRQEFLQRSSAPPEQAFELTVLALIVMNGDRISDEDLWRLLDEVGIQTGPTARPHPVFGKAEDKIKHMVTKKFLREQKARGGEQGKFYEWGANAEDEIGRTAVDTFIKQTIEPGEA